MAKDLLRASKYDLNTAASFVMQFMLRLCKVTCMLIELDCNYLVHIVLLPFVACKSKVAFLTKLHTHFDSTGISDTDCSKLDQILL